MKAKYRGYEIRFSSIWKNGQPVIMFYASAQDSDEEIIKIGKKVIDDYIDNKTST